MSVRKKGRKPGGGLLQLSAQQEEGSRGQCCAPLYILFWCFWFLKGWSALLDGPYALSPLYTLTTGQPGNTPGAETLHRNSCTTRSRIAATQSAGYKRKNWRGGLGSKSMRGTGAHPNAVKGHLRQSWRLPRKYHSRRSYASHESCVISDSPVCKCVDSWIQPQSFLKQEDRDWGKERGRVEEQLMEKEGRSGRIKFAIFSWFVTWSAGGYPVWFQYSKLRILPTLRVCMQTRYTLTC